MSTLTKIVKNSGDIKNVLSEKYGSLIENESSHKLDSKRAWSTIYFIVATFTGSVVFIVSWFHAYLSWGFWPGVCLGWIPALLIGVAAGLIWPLVVFILIVYLLFLGYTGTV
jgi:hypothetical protein